VHFGNLLAAVCVLWVLSETGLWVARRSQASAARRDRGSLAILSLTIYPSVGLGVWLGASGAGALPMVPPAVRWVGLFLILAGLGVRWWAILTLKHHFTVDVAIRQDHQLIQSGPYSRVRHPSYSGALLSFLGLALVFRNGLTLLVLLLPITAAFLWRIRIEEQALASAFPDEYPQYCRKTRRLIPGLL
jgi:protein-S-isoprenylcysteine O-methyltransferase Ste14